MPEEEGTTEQTSVGLVDATGQFAENWRDSLPEDIRADESLNVLTDFQGAIKQLVTANKMIGKDKVVVPGPNASDEEKAEFHKALGKPQTLADYKFTVPDDMKETYTEERMTKARQLADALNATQEQFETYMKLDADAERQAILGAGEQHDLDVKNADDELRKRFGNAYDERMHVANRLIEEVCQSDEERKFRLLKALDNADVAEFVSDCGAKLVSHKALIADITRATPKEAEVKMAELRATPGYVLPDAEGKLLSNTDPTKYKAITEEIATLVKDTYPDARPARPAY